LWHGRAPIPSANPADSAFVNHRTFTVLQAADGNADFVQQDALWNLFGVYLSLTGR
jgi:hypothetical protein